MTHTETWAVVAGCKIRIMRKGTGAPLLFLHGASGAARWLPFMEQLAETHDVIVPEHPGFGTSDTPDWLDNIGDMAYFYLDLIASLGLGPVHLVGSSLGGWIAAELAVRNPTTLKSLTVIGPAGIHVPGVARADMFMMSPEALSAAIFHDPAIAAAMPAPTTEAEVMTVLKNRLTTAKLAWSPRFYNPDLMKWMHRITAPTLVIWGDDDRIMPTAYAPEWQARIPGAQVQIVPACGHLPHVEKPQDFTARVTAFIRKAA